MFEERKIFFLNAYFSLLISSFSTVVNIVDIVIENIIVNFAIITKREVILIENIFNTLK